MIGGHVGPNLGDHVVVVVTASDETALAPDQLRHQALLFSAEHYRVRQSISKMVGVALASPGMRIQICGPLAVDYDDQGLHPGLPGQEGRLLFTDLVVNRHRQIPSDELAEALWREPDPGLDRDHPLC